MPRLHFELLYFLAPVALNVSKLLASDISACSAAISVACVATCILAYGFSTPSKGSVISGLFASIAINLASAAFLWSLASLLALPDWMNPNVAVPNPIIALAIPDIIFVFNYYFFW